MHFWLLTHEREMLRPTNTGRLIRSAQRIIWQRKAANLELLQQISLGNIALLYPGNSNNQLAPPSMPDHLIILDATWQEAQKMYNQSKYLHGLPKISLDGYQSTYTLRRNQKGLCTAEVAAYALLEIGRNEESKSLLQRLQQWQQNKINGPNHLGN